MSRDLLADDDSAHSRRDHGGGFVVFQLLREESAHMRRHGGILQKQRTLEKLTAVESAAQDEMPVQERAGLSKEI
jgi:hypothetical protein